MLRSRTCSVIFSRHYRIAVVGAGPGGFYAAHHLIHKGKNLPLLIDFFDRSPTPFGLSRYGVAPDHPEVKNCEDYMSNLFTEHPDKVRFFGNVHMGRDVLLKQLEEHYHLIILAYGCTASDRKLNVPGSDQPGVISARKFVEWYNGVPALDTKQIEAPPLDKVSKVTIIGSGNVAIDCARVLLADPAHWDTTDIRSSAVDLLRKSSVKEVRIVARRGLLESAFTNKEIRELLELPNVKFEPISEEILAPLRSRKLGRVEKRKVGLLDKASSASVEEPAEPGQKKWALEFLLSPAEFIQNTNDQSLLSHTVFDVNELVEDSLTKAVLIRKTGKSTTIENELVIVSIGYQGASLPGFEDIGIEFVGSSIPNVAGRVLKAGTNPLHLTYKRGWYVLGWAKTGPRGVIATTLVEAFDTAEQVLEDLSNNVSNTPTNDGDIALATSVDWQGWQRINTEELARAENSDKPRCKIDTVREMTEIASS